MKKLILALLISTGLQSAFATSNEDIIEALKGSLYSNPLDCKLSIHEYMKESITSRIDTIIGFAPAGEYELVIDDQRAQPLVKIIKDMNSNYRLTVSFTTDRDFKVVESLVFETYSIKDSRINTGTVIEPIFANEQVLVKIESIACN